MKFAHNSLSNNRVTLYPLTIKDADFVYRLYSHPLLAKSFDESVFLPDETSTQFIKRIISLCELIFTIRPADHPDLIIGDCALHHWDKRNKQIEIGGSLLPEYWGQGYMKAAFELLIEIAKHQFGIIAICGVTKTRNSKAIQLAQKMGFVPCQTNELDTMLRKEI